MKALAILVYSDFLFKMLFVIDFILLISYSWTSILL